MSNKIIKNKSPEEQISSLRFKQIKYYAQELRQALLKDGLKPEDVMFKESILWQISNDLKINNQKLETPLQTFINNYLANHTKKKIGYIVCKNNPIFRSFSRNRLFQK